MFISRTPGDRFPPDDSRGPELRQGLRLLRVINTTGLQIRRSSKLDSTPCGRLEPGQVFGVNYATRIEHRKRRLVRLHVVQPLVGWVSGIEKWVEYFSDDNNKNRPGPIPLPSTLSEGCAVVMKCNAVRLGSRVVASALEDCRFAVGHRSSAGLSSRRSRWLHYRGEGWPTAAVDTPGPPHYSPQAEATTEAPGSVIFPKEKRFLCTTIRCLTNGHERQALGLFSPGPGQYVGREEVSPVLGSASAPAGHLRNDGHTCDGPERHRRAAAAARATRLIRPRYQRSRKRKHILSGPGFIGVEEREIAERHLGKAKAGSTGVHVMRLPISGQNDGASTFLPPRLGAESPGPARHFPGVSCISSRGCPVFATPRRLEPELVHRVEEREGSGNRRSNLFSTPQSDTLQEVRRWPEFTHYKNGKITGNLGSDSPGPGVVNIADHDPFRPVSFLKRDVCHPPPATFVASKRSWRGNVGLRRT